MIDGDKGHDVLLGQKGNNLIIGGAGKDKLTGGSGRDTFVYKSLNDGMDTICKFDVEKDLLDLSKIFKVSQFEGPSNYQRFERFTNFVQVGQSTHLRVDADGNGASTEQVTLAVVKGVTNSHIGKHHYCLGLYSYVAAVLSMASKYSKAASSLDG